MPRSSIHALTWFSSALGVWYKAHARALPWRATRDPYRIWLSEVILQQTRVDQGMAYWHRFVDQYPTVNALAAAPEEEVLKLWLGLGYYSRARNLRTAAQQIVKEHGGKFPSDYDALQALKGVGEYTAAAIGSICFDLHEPVVDGNVYRVLSRVFDIDTPIDSTQGKKEFRALAATLLPKTQPGDHNQSVMELGATICTPKQPNCAECPLASKCIALRTDRISTLPIKAKKTAVRARYFNYLHIVDGNAIYLNKRKEKDIWSGLYELPLVETDTSGSPSTLKKTIETTFGKGWKLKHVHGPVKHILSHQHLHATFYMAEPPKSFRTPTEWTRVETKKLSNYPVPRLIDRYFMGEF